MATERSKNPSCYTNVSIVHQYIFFSIKKMYRSYTLSYFEEIAMDGRGRGRGRFGMSPGRGGRGPPMGRGN